MTNTEFRPRTGALATLMAVLVALTAAVPAHAQSSAERATKAAPAKAHKRTVKPARSAAKKPARKPATPDAAAPVAAPAAVPAVAPTRPDTAAVPQRQREADFIVAVVNTEPVTNNEVRARVARAERLMSDRGAPVTSQETLRRDMLERLIAERAQLQFARESGLKVDDAALAQAELAIARQNDLRSIDELHRRVQQEGLTLKDFRDDVRNQVLLARLREREIEPRVKVTDAEVEAFIREQTGARAGQQAINLAMILVAVPEGAPTADVARLEQRAQEVVRRSRAGDDFAKLAEEFSDANNRGRDGGVLGLRTTDRYPDLFVQATQRARVGEIVGPVKSDAGFHVLKVIERKQNTDLPEVRIPQARVRHILLRTGPTQSERVAVDRLADFKRRVQSGQARFEALAQQYSQDGSASDGGDLGWASPGQFVPEFEQAMNNLDPGQISDPVVSRFGVHLIRVDERREQVLSPDEQRKMARGMLRERKAQEAFETWSQEVRGRAYVQYRDPPR